MKVRIFVDGACAGNPGPGGYASITEAFIEKKWKTVASHEGGFRRTTNNRMELMAAIEGLRSVKNKTHEVEVITDSSYVSNYFNFVKTRTINGPEPDFTRVPNGDLWVTLHEEAKKFSSLKFMWVKGHDGNHGNEACDKTAVSWTKKEGLPADLAYEEGMKAYEEEKKKREDASKKIHERFDKNPFRHKEETVEAKICDVPATIKIAHVESRIVISIGGMRFVSNQAFRSQAEAYDALQRLMEKEKGDAKK